ncbi:Type 1 glutamine amidotransferase-like domain-containing protein [Falsibacillus albus]|uniref:Peptidase E n=1 Tax=Falsibacillus albus TaxID=2478915 RepID=A0A3L7JTP7_9BACI|nr:peptidase E [Falsibacillus albus]RLQ94213.1 peptidase E [Falsibacillus albus]
MKQIIALGGGGFSMEPDNPLLDKYILKQAGKEKPKICFVPTASGDADSYIQRFYDFFSQHQCSPSHLSLFKPPTRDLESFVLEKDIMYVGGGNTKNLLVLWKEWGLDGIMKKAWEQGIILAGISAGSLCWFEEGVTDSFGNGLEPITGLGLLKGSNCPHFDGETERRPAYHDLIQSEKLRPGYAADDGAALHFIEENLFKVVSSRPNALAYRMSTENANVIEEPIKPIYLGDS